MLTVCVVTFNAEHCIEKTLRNLVKNNVVTRIIVKDGLSHDRTPEIVNTFDDSRIEFVSRKDNGIYNAMNQAMNMVKDGSYFVFINADDILINENFDAVNFTGHDVFISPVILSQNGKRIKIHCPDITKINRMNVHHQGFFCRKSAHTPRFNPSLGLLADLAWMREVINFAALKRYIVLIFRFLRQLFAVFLIANPKHALNQGFYTMPISSRIYSVMLICIKTLQN